ncbi:MAG TPA: RNA methyltransferase [Streptosporangiaceae bacterium]|jgi:tRNA G18 (ribose-2'-O)-methylase SpoU|nr:RNA methyltransferase [Streptosporangiaceae bacterium]
MADLVSVADAADTRLRDFVRLRDVHLRKSLEAAHGLFIAEGEKVIRRAVAAGHPVRAFLMAERWVASLADVLDGVDAPAYVVDDATAEAVTGFAVHRGALAAMDRLPLPAVADVIADVIADDTGVGDTGVSGAHPRPRPGAAVLVLEDLIDHGNVGAIFRCAAALGVRAVILSPRCADPLYRRAVKVSMGAVFAVPYARMTNWYDGLTELRDAGFKLLALTPDQSAVPLTGPPMVDRVALLLGTEGDGLSSRWLHEADEAVCIPMSAAAMTLGVDSLNVVAAAAIACHTLTRG